MTRKILLVLLMISLVGAANAQEIDPCFGLAVEDCTVIGDASANSFATLETFTHAFSLDFSLTGLEALGLGEDLVLNVTGTGSFSRADSEVVPAALELVIEGTRTIDGETDEGVVTLRLVDDVLYVQMDETGWRSIAIQDVLQSPALATASLAGMPFGTTGTDPELDLTSSLQSLASLLNVPEFIGYTRLTEDASRSPFSFSLDFVPLFDATEFREILDDGLRLLSSVDPNLESTAMMAPLLLEASDLKVNLTQYVNGENLIDALDLTINGIVDLNTVLGTTEQNRIEPITLSFGFSVQLADINQPLMMTAPESAAPVSLSELGLE